MNKFLGLGIIVIVLIGIVAGVVVTQRQTQLKSKAAQPTFGSISVAKSSINLVNNNWESIPINVNISVPGANNSKTVAGVFVTKTAEVSAGTGWTAIGHYYGSNGADSFSWTPPSDYASGSYTFALFSMDQNTVLDFIQASSPVQFAGSSSGGGTGTGTCKADTFDAASCRICASDGSHWIVSFGPNKGSTEWCSCAKKEASFTTDPQYSVCPGGGSTTNNGTGVVDAAEFEGIVFKQNNLPASSLTAGQTYDVEITMSNRDRHDSSYLGPTWTAGDLSKATGYFLGFPTTGDNGAGDFKVNTDTAGTNLSINSLWQINWTDPKKLRIPLGNNVSPCVSGNVTSACSYTFKTKITPQKAGTHTFYWGMVHEGVNWFGAQYASSITVAEVGSTGSTPTPSLASTPSASPAAVKIEYRIAEGNTTADAKFNLGAATYSDYKPVSSTSTMRLPYTFANLKINDVRYIAVQFKKGDKQTDSFVTKLIGFVGPTPTVSGFACDVNIAGSAVANSPSSDLLLTFTGTGFGSQSGTITLASGGTVSVDSWTDTMVVGRLSNLQPSSTATGTNYSAALTAKSGQKAQDLQGRQEQSCLVGITQISLGAKLFCRAQRDFDQDNVELVLILNKDRNQKTSEKVTIDKDGNITDIKTKLKSGENYIACIKAPFSVRKCSPPFSAVSGNNILSMDLPVGDYNGDGAINNFDKSILENQWGPMNTNKNCDVNRDGFCNSFEWSCMLHNFNASDQQSLP